MVRPLMAVSAWVTGSKLKLNPSESEFLLIGTKTSPGKKLNNFPCLILGQDTNPSASAKNIGVVFDSSLTIVTKRQPTCTLTYLPGRNAQNDYTSHKFK